MSKSMTVIPSDTRGPQVTNSSRQNRRMIGDLLREQVASASLAAGSALTFAMAAWLAIEHLRIELPTFDAGDLIRYFG